MAEIKKAETTVKPVAAVKTPVASTKAPEVKAEVKKEVVKETPEKKLAAKKPAAKKATTAKKAEPKKETVKAEAKKAPAAKKAAPAKKAAAVNEDVKTNIVLQYGELNVTYDTIVTNSKNNFVAEMGGNADEIKKLSIYVKPEEYAAYYVVNDKVQGRIGL